MYYAWCNANCTQATGWDAWDLGLPPEYGAGADLAFDTQNRPRMAYYVGTAGYGLGYSSCTTNCESHSPTWASRWVETAAALNASDPVPLQPGCSLSSWYPGKRPALALDTTGSPFFEYDAEHLQGGTCAAHTDILLVRYASFGAQHTLYLPLTLR